MSAGIQNRVLFLVTALLLSVADAHASTVFTGSTVTLSDRYPDINTIGSSYGPTTVGSGVEFPTVGSWYSNGVYVGPAWTADVGANTISLTELGSMNSVGGAQFNGFLFEFANAPTISGVSLDPASTLSVTSLSYSANTVAVNYANSLIYGPVTTILNVSFASAPVPLPPAIWLLGSGLAGLGMVSKRARRSFAA